MFDLVLEAAKASVVDTGEKEFSAAELYHLATRRYPELKLKKSSWVSHVIASAPNHSSYHHYSSHRRFLRHLGRGRYTLDPSLPVEDK
ncbi:MAG: hypothetical protein Q8O05_04305 [Chloroflexota bacterium]|nr:hypothetical protein [Chloroflexota bacterium]